MDVFMPQRRRLLGVAALVLLVLVLGIRHLSAKGNPAAVARDPLVPGRAHASANRLVVDVVGAVRRPGLYRLPEGARIADAVRRAGGTTRKADLESINLAAPLADGLQVVVPRRIAASPASAAGDPAAAAGPVHLNTATLEQLDALPGVGPVTAQRILDYRQAHGAFVSVDDLDLIPGIGPARMEQLRDLAAP